MKHCRISHNMILPILLFAVLVLSPTVKSDTSVPNRIIVKFKKHAGDRMAVQKGQTISESLDEFGREYPIESVLRLGVGVAGKGTTGVFQDVYFVDLVESSNALSAASALMQQDNVAYAEVDRLAEFYEIPDDPYYQYLWNLNNTGQEHYYVIRHLGPYNDTLSMMSGASGADIDALAVYENPPEKAKIPVAAIIDTGVDLDHPDLSDNIWVNADEIPGDGIDNDHNGFIDDINGWDFGDLLFGSGDNDPTDSEGHGTHIAGTIAAATNNGVGIAGIMPECKIMAVKIDPLPLVSSIAQAVIYAADNGADAINMSFGLAYPSPLMEEALAYAYRKGVILCAASGNSGSAELNYPATSQYVIAVGATNSMDRVTTFSTYGDHIDISAPGEAILSLRANTTDMYGSDYPQEPGVHVVDDIYYVASGTSMACPHVVGTAAYLRAISPGISPSEAENILISASDDITDPFGAGWDLPGWDMYSGHGRVNLAKTIEAAPDIQIGIESPSPFAILQGSVEISGFASGSELSGYALEYGEGADPTSWTTIENGLMAVAKGILGTWHTAGPDGLYTLRLRSDKDTYHAVLVHVINESRVEILNPLEGENIYGYTAIYINAYAPKFQKYILEYRIADSGDAWTELTVSTSPAFGELALYWNTEELAPGDYELRLRMINDDGSEIVSAITVSAGSIFGSANAWKVPVGAVPTIVPNYGDFDRDGEVEIVVTSESGVHVYNSDGSPKLDGLPSFPNNNFMIPPAVGDLNGDSKDDLVLMGYDPPMIYAYLSGDTHFQVYYANFPNVNNFRYSEGQFPIVFLRDIDSDGRDEIFAHLPSADKAFLIGSDGTDVYEFDNVSRIQPADLDGDGHDEIYTFHDGFSEIREINSSGEILQSRRVVLDDMEFRCNTMTANDVDNDGQAELILFGYHPDDIYYIYIYDDGLVPFPDMPLRLGLNNFIVPTSPIFADLDNNGQLEILSGFFDIDYSYIHAWNLDGSSYLPGSEGGLFAVTSHPGMLNMIVVADIDGDQFPELLASANDDLFSVYANQRLYAWDYQGRSLPGFPIISALETGTGYRYTPVIMDLDNDGSVDIGMTTSDNGLALVKRPGMIFQECASPVPHWRYNRRLNGIGPGITPCSPTDITGEPEMLPAEFTLEQNYPNPFNPSTTISFSLPERSEVSLTIYNILGQKAATVLEGFLPAGTYQYVWNGNTDGAKQLSTGVYFYRLTAGDFSQTRKMLYLK